VKKEPGIGGKPRLNKIIFLLQEMERKANQSGTAQSCIPVASKNSEER